MSCQFSKIVIWSFLQNTSPDILYRVDDYIGESARRIIERVKDHGGRDTKSHVLKRSSEKEHVEVTQEDFKVIGSHFKNNRLIRKITEALLIKQERPSFDVQDQSVKLTFLN